MSRMETEMTKKDRGTFAELSDGILAVPQLPDAQETRTLRCASEMLEAIRAIDSGSDLQPIESIELLRVAVEALNKVCSPGNDYREFTTLGELGGLQPAAVGQVILSALPFSEERWSTAKKSFWIEIAEELGPDYIETFRSVGAFLKRVEGF